MSNFGLGDALRSVAKGLREPRLGEWDLSALALVADELERVNDDLESQIHEDGGFIERIVELEEENARLGAEVMRRLAQVGRVRVVHETYFNTDVDPYTGGEDIQSEDMWRFDRDLREALVVDGE
jgi:hypothetical protein